LWLQGTKKKKIWKGVSRELALKSAREEGRGFSFLSVGEKIVGRGQWVLRKKKGRKKGALLVFLVMITNFREEGGERGGDA